MRIFISYRREGGSTSAQLLELMLKLRGYDVFLDHRSLHSYGGYFDEQILRAIESADNFLLVLSPGIFDRCDDPADWVRQEIAFALRIGVNIVPVMMEGFRWPRELPEDIADVQRYHAHTFYGEYSDACMARICDNLVEKQPEAGQPEAAAFEDRGEFPGEDCDLEALRQAEHIDIPQGYTSIRGGAFKGWTRLKHIAIPRGVTFIGAEAFRGCSSLQSVVIPDGVTSLEPVTFYECSSLQSVTIPASVTSMGISVFYGCRSLKRLTIPEGVTSLGDWVCFGCSSLESVDMPDSVTSIGGQAFRGCRSLKRIIIPKGVSSIGELAFEGCSSLTEITIPDSVTSMGHIAFAGCSSLTDISLPASISSAELCFLPSHTRITRRG